MRPLSIFKFIRGSVVKILPMAVTVCLAVTVLYFMSAFVKQLDNQINETSLYPLKNMSIIFGGNSGIKQEDVDKLNSNFEKTEYFFAQCIDIMVYNAVGNTSTILIMTENRNISSVMDMQNIKLIEGKMPEQPMEVIMHKRLAANHGLQVGSVIKKGQKGWRISDEIKVAGLFDGAAVYAMGIVESDTLKPGIPGIAAVVAAEDEHMADANSFIEENFASKYNLYTSGMVKKLLKNFSGPMNALKSFVGVVLVLVMGVFLANITTIQYSVRKKELELLHAIGYTRKYIIKKALTEIGIAGLIGYIFGVALAVAICWVINVSSWNERGLSLPLLSLDIILSMLLVPVFITLFSIIAPVRMTKFRDIA